MSIAFNNYDDSIADPVAFKQFAVKDALFLHYRCPQVDKHIQLFSHYNEIMFTLEGSRTMHHSGKSWTMKKHSCLFTRKTAYLQELPELVGWEVLAFYFQDGFFRQVLNEYRQYLPLRRTCCITRKAFMRTTIPTSPSGTFCLGPGKIRRALNMKTDFTWERPLASRTCCCSRM